MGFRAVWPDLVIFYFLVQIYNNLWPFLEDLFSIRKNFEPTLANILGYWANFRFDRLPNI